MQNGMLIEYDGKRCVSAIQEQPVNARLKKAKTFETLLKSDWKNLLISGDNFTAMKMLLSEMQIEGKIQLVYIDPPFSTNQIFKTGNGRTATISRSDKDIIAYRDMLSGPEYLEFLRERLILLRGLLSPNGSIYIHIDCKMGHYVKIVMDEVFGPERFINDITRIKCNPKNFKREAFGNIKDMVLFYSKTPEYIWNDSRDDLTEEDIIRLFPKVSEDGRRYTTTPLHAPGETLDGPTGKSWRKMRPPIGRHWRNPPQELESLDKAGLIEWSSTGNPRKIIYADDVISRGKKKQDVWKYKDPVYPRYPTEKNLEMLKMIINTSSNPNDLVLDCFAGSGTTLVGAEETGRRWIGIDQSESAIRTCCERLAKVQEHRPFIVYEVLEGKEGSHGE